VITRASPCDGDVAVGDLVQYYYCPRKVYFLRVLGVTVPPRSKMRLGKSEHEKEYKRVKERTTVYGFDPHEVERVSHNVYVEHECGLYGQIDTVVVLRSGDVVPVEVKYSDQTVIFQNWRKQVVAYALLLRTVFGPRVKYGLIYFPRKKNGLTIAITHDDVAGVLNDVKRLRQLLASERLPRGAREAKCHYCEVAKFCVK